jgi:hypothetical protein
LILAVFPDQDSEKSTIKLLFSSLHSTPQTLQVKVLRQPLQFALRWFALTTVWLDQTVLKQFCRGGRRGTGGVWYTPEEEPVQCAWFYVIFTLFFYTWVFVGIFFYLGQARSEKLYSLSVSSVGGTSGGRGQPSRR